MTATEPVNDLTAPPTYCPHCGAPVRVLATVHADKVAEIVVEADPRERGTVVVIAGVAGVLQRIGADAARAAGKPTYQHHRLSCTATGKDERR